jgi:hypothetical protein
LPKYWQIGPSGGVVGISPHLFAPGRVAEYDRSNLFFNKQ